MSQITEPPDHGHLKGARTGLVTTQLVRLQTRLGFLQKAAPFRERVSSGAEQGCLSAAAAVIAYVPAQALGMQEGFWGAITAIAVLQSEFKATRSTARDQFLGAAIGGAVALATLFVLPSGVVSYGLAVALSLLACWLLNIGSAARLAGITATIVLLVPHTGSPERMFLSRIAEVGWGLCVAVSVVWLVHRLRTAFFSPSP